MKKQNIEELNNLYTQAEQVDTEVFAEQRAHILLAAGDHYAKQRSRWLNRLREAKQLSNEARLRLTLNHVHRISKTLANSIIQTSPGVKPFPNNEKELADIKSAELNGAVWEYAKAQNGLTGNQTLTWATDFIEIGEVATKIFWNPLGGRFIGYDQAVDEEGNPLFEEDGSPAAGETAVFSGDLEFEPIYGFNLLRAPEAKTIKDSPYLIIRKMVSVDTLKALVGEDEDLQSKITPSKDDTFLVFDQARQGYRESENQTLVKEYYFRPGPTCPQGYYYITVQEAILFEGELPYGIFPIEYEGYDSIATTPRHRSIIKQIRPLQVELNRALSKMAEHQITLGDDKIIMLNGSKVTGGPHIPGIRTLFVNGMAPTVLPGRTGEQYLPYAEFVTKKMYEVANVDQELEEKQLGDPMAYLYASIRNKKKFSLHAERFENFLVRICKLYLNLAKNYFDENMLVPAIGKTEYINIAEFKNTEPLEYQIKIEKRGDDIETMMGKHMVFNHVLQYVGQNLQKEDIGKILRQMPFANSEKAFEEFTLDEDTATNIILQLDRGEMPQLQKHDKTEYIAKRLSSRMKMSDFRYLHPEIQKAYEMILGQCEDLEARKMQEIKQAQSQFIPSGGANIKVDYYVPDPNNKTRSIRATVPAEAVDWLIKQLNIQGSSQEQLQRLDPSVLADISQKFMNGQQPTPEDLPPQMSALINQQTGGILQ